MGSEGFPVGMRLTKGKKQEPMLAMPTNTANATVLRLTSVARQPPEHAANCSLNAGGHMSEIVQQRQINSGKMNIIEPVNCAVDGAPKNTAARVWLAFSHWCFVATCVFGALGYFYIYHPYHALKERLGGRP